MLGSRRMIQSLLQGLARLPGWLWIPMLVLPPLIVMGVLQFRWLAQLSEHEHKQRHAQLKAAASRFADEFNRELTRAYVAFQLDGDALARGDAHEASSHCEYWKVHAPRPQLIRDIWLAIPGPGAVPPVDGLRLVYLDAKCKRLVNMPVPARIEHLRRGVEASALRSASGAIVQQLIAGAFDEQAFAIIVPFMHSALVHEGAPTHAATILSTGFVIVQLNQDYIVHNFLPELTQRNFSTLSESGDLEYRITVVRSHAPYTRIYVSHPQENDRSSHSVEAIAPLLRVRSFPQASRNPDDRALGLLSWRMAALSPATAGISTEQPDRRREPAYWQLRVAHRSGSLADMAERTQQRQLIASSTILALLAASMMFLFVAWRRARALARQQLEFVASISHELRTPVTAMQTMAANLSDGVVRDFDQVRHYGQLIQYEARRLVDMTEQVLGFARIESARPALMEHHSVAALIHRAVQAMQSQMEDADFHCDIQLADALPRILVDAAAIERALQNLIGNALKYSSVRREIRIAAGVEMRRAGPAVWIAVEDHGMGIEPDELTLIFEPFRRGRAAIEQSLPGTGLGLSLVRRIVHAHGGKIDVYSEPSVGSTFTIRFPAARTVTSRPGKRS